MDGFTFYFGGGGEEGGPAPFPPRPRAISGAVRERKAAAPTDGLLHVTDVLGWHGPPCAQIYMERGSHVHEACDLMDAGILDWSTVHPEWTGYVEAWQRCQRELGITVLASELPIADRARAYCGRLDRICLIGKTKQAYVLDLKTGRPQPTVGPQTAAYLAALTREQIPAEHAVRRRAVCQLSADGTYRVVLDDTPRQQMFHPHDYRIFLNMLSVKLWEQANGLWSQKPRKEA